MTHPASTRREGASARRASTFPGRSRAGFALITVLWLVTMLSTLVALGLAGTRLGHQAALNRLSLTRARWAAAACLAIAHARWSQGRAADSATVDLGRRTSCQWRLADPTARLNVNMASSETLRSLLGDAAADRIIERRNQESILDLDELSEDDLLPEGILELLTVDGPGTINANSAPTQILRATPGLAPEAVERLLAERIRSPPRSLDALVAALTPPARVVVFEHYAELTRLLTFAAPQYVLTARGWVGPDPDRLVATTEQLVVPLPERLAVIRQRVRG